MAYTYYLLHIPTGKRYYGARYAKDCHPDELWKSYFSSSPLVHELISIYGINSFEISIRKIFETAEEAISWEHRFLSKIKAQQQDAWLNRHNGRQDFLGPHSMSDDVKERIRQKITGMKRSDETRQKLSEAAKQREELRRKEGWKMPKESIDKALKTRTERIASGKINPYSDERNKKMGATKRGARRHYLDDGSFIMIKPQADQYASLDGEQ